MLWILSNATFWLISCDKTGVMDVKKIAAIIIAIITKILAFRLSFNFFVAVIKITQA